MPHIISVDAGSSSLRSVLFNETGEKQYAAQRHYVPFSPAEGCSEQMPSVFGEALFDTLCEVMEYARAHSLAIGALGVTSQRSSVFGIGKDGRVLCNALTWHDKRAVPLCGSMRDCEPKVFRKTGLRLDPMFSAPKMAWLRQYEQEIYRNAYKLIGVHEYMLYMLTNKFVTDHSIASRTMLQDLQSLAWDDDLLSIFGLDREKLCDIVPQGSICGCLTENASSQTGLPAGIPVVTAGGDQQCGTLGLGIVRPGQLAVTTGTGAYVAGVAERPVIDGEMRFLCNVAALPGQYVMEAPVLTAGNIYRWFGEFCFGKDVDHTDRMDTLNGYAQNAPAGANGLVLFPYFKGRGAPSWDAARKSVFYGAGLETSRGDFARAILESIAFELAENVEIMEQGYARMDGALLASGGLTRLPLYNQVIADITGKSVIVTGDSEATARGAWVLAGVACGDLGSVEDSLAAALANEENQTYAPGAGRTQYAELKEQRKEIYQKVYQ